MNRFATKFVRAVVDHPWTTIIAFSLMTAVLASALPRIYIDPDTRKILPQHHPDMIFEDWARLFFGIEPPAVVVVANEGADGVFTPATLKLVHYVSERIEALDSVNGDDVVSLAAIDNITADEDSLTVDPFFDEPPATAAQARRIHDAVFANPMMPGNVVSRDGKATMILAEGLPETDKLALYDALKSIVSEAPIDDETVTIAGQPVVEGEMGRVARSDIAHMFPLVILTVAILLALTLRSLRGVVLPLLVVFTSCIWTFGLMAWTGAPVHAVSSMMPSLLIAIGVADGIHIVHHFLLRAGELPDDDARSITYATMRELIAPVVMTSITTAVGFVSLAISSLESMQILGSFLAFGVMAAMIFSLTILPAVLCILPLPHRAAARAAQAGHANTRVATKLMHALTRATTSAPRLVLALGALAIVGAATGIPRVVIEASLIANFPHDNPVAAADEIIRSHFVGSTPIEIVLDGGSTDAWKDPANLKALVRMQDDLEGFVHLGRTRSIADYIRRMNQVMNPSDPSAYSIPDDRNLIAQYLLLYSISGDPDDFDDVVDYDYRYANVRSTVAGDSSRIVGETVDFVQHYLDENITPLGINGRVTGTAQTSSMFIGLIISSQIRSLIVGLIFVGILAGLLGRSALAGIYCLVPVLIATVANFAVMGWGDIPLSVSTALVSSMGIGIGVDYAIHFVVRYRREASRGSAPAAALATTMSTSGVAIFYNALVVMVGFSVLSTSGFAVNQRLGLLASVNMAVCATATLTVLAAALFYMRPAFTRVPDRNE